MSDSYYTAFYQAIVWMRIGLACVEVIVDSCIFGFESEIDYSLIFSS